MSAAALRRIRDDGSWSAPQWPMPLGIGGQFSAAVSDPVGYPRAQLSIPSTATPPKWIKPTLERLSELASLGHDWDQRGSAEVSIDVLSFAANILGQSMPPTAPPPSIVPLGHGGVQMLWHNQVADLEVEVIQPNEVVFYCLNKVTGHEEEIPLTTDLSALTNCLWSHFKT